MMHRVVFSALLACLGVALLAATPHPNVSACKELEGVFSQAEALWNSISDSETAESLRPVFSMMEFHAVLLAQTLENGGTIETTRAIHQDLVNAGNAFLSKARELGVSFPQEEFNRYMEYAQVCSAAY